MNPDKTLLEKMYRERKDYNKLFRAKTYMDAAHTFCNDYMHMFNEMCDEIEAGGDNRQNIIQNNADNFVTCMACVIKEIEGKEPKGREMLDINLYMVMYVFPCIIETGRSDSEELAKRIVEKWNASFKNTNLQYSDYKSIDSGFKRKLCYITTAVCESMGKADDCYELTTLRRFRDEYMSATDAGRRLIQEYYDTAPAIVLKIDTRADAANVYRTLYDAYINPCVSMIEAGRMKECLEHYKLMVRQLTD